MKDELCALCGGQLEARVVRVVHERGPDGAPVIVDGVRAEVCMQCGHRWFALDVMRELEAIYRGEKSPSATQEVKVYSFA